MRFAILAPLGTLAIVAIIGRLASGAPARELADREEAFGAIRPFDLVFQDLDCGERCALIRRFTRSRYTHVGIVLEDQGERRVYEALGPVGAVPLEDWVRRGIGGAIAVYRPNRELAERLEQVGVEVRRMVGRPYDADYQWDDERIYCSEVVAKAYRSAFGRDVFPPHTVDLGDDAARVAALSHGRFLPTTQLVSPADLARSDAFDRVVDELEPSIVSVSAP